MPDIAQNWLSVLVVFATLVLLGTIFGLVLFAYYAFAGDTVLQTRVDATAGRQCRDRERRLTLFNKQSRRGDGKTRFVVVPDSIGARCLGVVHLGGMARQKPLGTSQAI